MIQSNNRKEKSYCARLTVVYTDIVAVVRADKSYITITPIAELAKLERAVELALCEIDAPPYSHCNT